MKENQDILEIDEKVSRNCLFWCQNLLWCLHKDRSLMELNRKSRNRPHMNISKYVEIWSMSWFAYWWEKDRIFNKLWWDNWLSIWKKWNRIDHKINGAKASSNSDPKNQGQILLFIIFLIKSMWTFITKLLKNYRDINVTCIWLCLLHSLTMLLFPP